MSLLLLLLLVVCPAPVTSLDVYPTTVVLLLLSDVVPLPRSPVSRPLWLRARVRCCCHCSVAGSSGAVVALRPNQCEPREAFLLVVVVAAATAAARSIARWTDTSTGQSLKLRPFLQRWTLQRPWKRPWSTTSSGLSLWTSWSSFPGLWW